MHGIGKPHPHCGYKAVQHSHSHPVQKFLQSAFHGVEEGMKIYGTLKGAYDLGKGAVAAVSSAATAAAPYVEAAAAMMV